MVLLVATCWCIFVAVTRAVEVHVELDHILNWGLGEWAGLLLDLMRLVVVVECAKGSDFALGDLMLSGLVRCVEVARRVCILLLHHRL